MIGEAGILLSFIAALGAVLAFTFFALGKEEAKPYANILFYGHLIGVIVASIYLLYALIVNKFEYYYVFAYTDQALDLPLRISAFWAGVEGTFLLWALLGGLVGVFILKYELRDRAPVMAILSFVQAVLLLFLVVMSPFRIMMDMPADGAGLNPLLKNPWMVVHPPVVFAGYAVLLIPFALVLVSLWKEEFQRWVRKALPWTHLGLLMLSMGIFFGAYWAYRVLGWGGYWSWDPVENASLVPWLTGVALIHGLLVQRGRKIWFRSNLLLAIFTYVFVFYATFLTRSGVLGDFSVHSFIETPLNPYMLGFLIFILVIGMGAFIYRYSRISSHEKTFKIEPGYISRETIMAYGMILLVASALLISAGTSAPLITTMLGAPSNVDDSFYMITNAPLAIGMGVLLGIIPFVKGKSKRIGEVIKEAIPFLILGIVGGSLTGWWLGSTSPVSYLYLIASFFALFANAYILYMDFRQKGWKATGAPLAHLGTALLLIGFIASYVYPVEEMVTLPRGEDKEVLGYTLTFQDRVTAPTEETYEVEVSDGTETFKLYPHHYVAGKEEQLMRDPDLRRYWWGDLFLSTQQFQYQREGEEEILMEGHTEEVQDYYITLKDMRVDHQTDAKTSVEAVLHVQRTDMTEENEAHPSPEEAEVMELTPTLTRMEEGFSQEGVFVEGTGDKIYLEEVDPASGGVMISLVDEDEVVENLVAELSRRPLIPYLTFSTVLIMAGFAVATWRRLRDIKD